MPPLEPIAVRQISLGVHEALERAIVECTLEPYAVLSDRQLATEFGVSRTPVRDALHLLESSGLVHRRGRVGWVVSGIDERDVVELFELRCLLEPAGLEHIARWDDERLLSVTSMFDEFDAPIATQDIERYLRRDEEFHQLIVGAADNRRLNQAYYVVDRQIDRCRHYTSYRHAGRVDRSLAEHRLVSEALARRDVDAARRHLVAHITTARDALIATVHRFRTTTDRPDKQAKEAL